MNDATPGEPVRFQAPLQRRPTPPEVADEREALEGWLDYFRALVVLALDGLDETALRRRIPAERGSSLLGIVKHLTELERTWLVERWGERGNPTAHAPSYVDDPDPGSASPTWSSPRTSSAPTSRCASAAATRWPAPSRSTTPCATTAAGTSSCGGSCCT